MEVDGNTAVEVVNIEDQMKQAYMDYAMSVIIGRALPDVRDGLKPVQKRVLYAMYREGLLSSRKTSKCAGVVGEVLKKYHPHGDIPVYDALVRLAQPWVLRYLLVDGQGNFGSIDGDPPAAYRYTECRMTAMAELLLQDIDKETVDFIPNFDESTSEPVVLPSLIPNLLVNGSDGIAVGMATHIPPHNLREVIKGTIALIENPNITALEMMQHIPGPDFPTGGIIHGRDQIQLAYSTGRGIIQIRARAEIETLKNKKDVKAIVITEIPFQVNKSRLLEKIAELYNEKKVEGISKLRDETDRKGMRIVVELKRDATPEVVLNQLYKLTPMQESFGVINLAIVEGRPVVCTLVDLLRHFIDHRRDVITRRTRFDLRKAEERMHILDGFKIVLLNLDDVIQLIKKSESPKEAKDGLIKKYELSAIQAQAVLELRLQRLTGMERLAIEKEHQELADEIKALKAILTDSGKVDAIIISQLKEVSEAYGDERRTQILDGTVEIEVADMIEDEEMAVTVSHAGYMKRTSLASYRAQRRGGKGVIGASSKEDDFIENLFVASTHADLMFFTNTGRLYTQKVYSLPESGRTAQGRALVNILSLKEGESVTAIMPVREFSENQFIFMATRKGIVKRMNLSEFAKVRKSGIIALGLEEGDALVGAGITKGQDEIILATHGGVAIRFPEQEVRVMGRSAVGVYGIRLEENDFVVGMTVVAPEMKDKLSILSVCQNGHGKRTAVEDYRVQGRGGKGIINIQADERNGPVVGVAAVTNESGIMIITSKGKIIRFNADNLSVIGRNTKGVRLIDLEEGEAVGAVAHVVDDLGNGAE